MPESAIVVHADWGTHPRKRWMARADRIGSGRFRCSASQPVGNADRLIPDLLDQAPSTGGVVVGFDFPIGLPEKYAAIAQVGDFKAFLEKAGSGEWSDFFRAAEHPSQIGLGRPFYPQRPGGTRQSQLVDALGLADFDDLRRRCEKARPGRGAACPLFWTLGGQQVGKAAISGWRDVIQPAIRRLGSAISLWPFDGPLAELIARQGVVLGETYPAEFYGHLGVEFPRPQAGGRSGKRVQADRAANARALLDWAARAAVEISADLEGEIRDGFGDGSDGEDRFDAVVGLFGMLNVLLGFRPSGEPGEPAVANVEGWILGQLESPGSGPTSPAPIAVESPPVHPMGNDLDRIMATLRAFARERDWERFHSPKNLAMALSVEAAELLEHFQWITEAESRELGLDERAQVAEEIADVQIYLMTLADKLGIDLVASVDSKIEKNRAHYPAGEVRGSAVRPPRSLDE